MGFLNTSLLPLFIFLSPGLIFIFFFFGGSRLTRVYSNRGVLMDAAVLIFVSSLINLLVAPVYSYIASYFNPHIVQRAVPVDTAFG